MPMKKAKVQKENTAKANPKARAGGTLEVMDFKDVAVDVEKVEDTKVREKANRRAKTKVSPRTMARKVDRKANNILIHNNVDYVMNLDIGRVGARTG